MDPTMIAKVVQALGIFEAVGKTITFLMNLAKDRANADQRQKIDEKLDEVLDKLRSGKMTITLALDEPLMEMLRQMAETPDTPRADWMQSTRGLIRGRETEFETLTELQISPQAIGTEALTNHDNWDSYDGMMDIVAAYLELPAPPVNTDLLSDSTFSRALAKVAAVAQSEPTAEDISKLFGKVGRLHFNDPRP